jgi:catalase-peroxidase
LGWKNSLGRGKGGDTITSGLEGAWTVNPAKWDHGYFEVLFGHEWELTKSPAGAQQWTPKNYDGPGVPDAHDPSKRHAPIMLTSDLALRMDPKYAPISKHFHENPQALEEAFAKAWYKLTHRDMGPISRCLGPKVPPPQLWQDPVPPLTYPTITAAHYQVWLKRALLEQAKLTPAQLVSVAWASASTFRQTDKRGGANGGRLLLSPQKEWACNAGLVSTLATMSAVQQQFNAQFHPVQVSMADLMVLGGCAGVEAAATAAGHEDVQVPFTPGRTDATQDMTDVESFAVLEPRADGFRNFLAAHSVAAKPEVLLVETADRLALTAKEMTVLLGGLRSIGLGGGGADDVALCRNVGQLSNEFFCNLLNDSVEWKETGYNLYQGVDRATGRVVWPSATRVDLIFGSHSVLRGLAESYATADSQKQFMIDFCAAFAKVMELDRFDVADMPTSRL